MLLATDAKLCIFVSCILNGAFQSSFRLDFSLIQRLILEENIRFKVAQGFIICVNLYIIWFKFVIFVISYSCKVLVIFSRVIPCISYIVN